MARVAQPEPTFEANLARLRDVVDRLERGDEGTPLPLEDALALFEEGVGLARAATASLDAAEDRVEVLLGDGRTVPLDGPGDDEDPDGT